MTNAVDNATDDLLDTEPVFDLCATRKRRSIAPNEVRAARERGRRAAEAYRLRSMGLADRDIARGNRPRGVEIAQAQAASRRSILKLTAWGSFGIGLFLAYGAVATGHVDLAAMFETNPALGTEAPAMGDRAKRSAPVAPRPAAPELLPTVPEEVPPPVAAANPGVTPRRAAAVPPVAPEPRLVAKTTAALPAQTDDVVTEPSESYFRCVGGDPNDPLNACL